MRTKLILLTAFLTSACGAIDQNPIQLKSAAPESDSLSLTSTSGSIELKVDTFFKKSTLQSSLLASDEKCKIPKNTIIAVQEFGAIKDNHQLITLSQTLPGCTLQSGYFYNDHIEIQKTPVFMLNIQQNTKFKISTQMSSELATEDICDLPKGTYSLSSTPAPIAKHYKISLIAGQIQCQFLTGYVYTDHTSLSNKHLIGSESLVNEMYQSQIDNSFLPESTCGITSLTMAIRFYGTKITSNQMIEKYDYRLAQSNATMGKILASFGLRTIVFNTATRSQLKSYLDLGRPIVLQNYFTRSGHIVAIVGYDDRGWIVNDPYGDWLGVRGSYQKNIYRSSYYGKQTHYTFAEVEAVEGINNYQGVAVYR